MNEVTHAFDYISTQFILIGLSVKVPKCKLWNPSGIFPGIKILHGYTLVTNGLCILGMPMAFQDFTMHFLDEVLS
jgi:hypothetical protein